MWQHGTEIGKQEHAQGAAEFAKQSLHWIFPVASLT